MTCAVALCGELGAGGGGAEIHGLREDEAGRVSSEDEGVGDEIQGREGASCCCCRGPAAFCPDVSRTCITGLWL